MTEGYWGPVTASVDWCEDNYVVTHYVAEFYNTLSSLPMVLLALFALWWGHRATRGCRYYAASCIASACVGAGSMLFHGTLTQEGQFLDEVPMLICICTFILLIKMTGPDPSPWTPVLLTAWAAFAVAVYMSSNFEVFCLMFFFSAVYAIYLSAMRVRRSTCAETKRLMKRFVFSAALGYLGSAFLLWIPEMLLCGNRLEETHDTAVRHLHLHAVYHLCAGVSIYSFLCFAVILNAEIQQRKPALHHHHPAFPIPTVIIK